MSASVEIFIGIFWEFSKNTVQRGRHFDNHRLTYQLNFQSRWRRVVLTPTDMRDQLRTFWLGKWLSSDSKTRLVLPLHRKNESRQNYDIWIDQRERKILIKHRAIIWSDTNLLGHDSKRNHVGVLRLLRMAGIKLQIKSIGGSFQREIWVQKERVGLKCWKRRIAFA